MLTVVFNYINAYSNNLTKRASSHEIPYSQLIDLIQEDQVAELKIENGVLYATPVDGYVYTEEATDKNKEPKSYTQSEKTPLILYTTALNDASLLPLLEEHNVKYTSPVQTQMSPILEFMIAYVLPTILLLGAFLLVMRLLAKNGRHRRHRQRGQIQCQGVYGEVHRCHLQGRGRSGRGQGVAGGDHRLPPQPPEVHGHRRKTAQGRSAGGLSRYRQDFACQGRGRRGQRPLLLHLRLGLCGDVRGRGRLPCP